MAFLIDDSQYKHSSLVFFHDFYLSVVVVSWFSHVCVYVLILSIFNQLINSKHSVKSHYWDPRDEDKVLDLRFPLTLTLSLSSAIYIWFSSKISLFSMTDLYISNDSTALRGHIYTPASIAWRTPQQENSLPDVDDGGCKPHVGVTQDLLFSFNKTTLLDFTIIPIVNWK